MLKLFKSQSHQEKPSFEEMSHFVKELSEKEQSLVSGGSHLKFLGEWIYKSGCYDPQAFYPKT